MKTASEQMAEIINAAEQACFEIYVKDARRVLSKCHRLEYLIAAMGTAFWVDRDGGTLGDNDHGTPETARKFLTETDADYFDSFKSPGVQIHRDKIVTNW